ncbi:MAG: hypothetical protein Q8T11_15960 [Elusimicrobiota bacterium]|nr:hypothetical protein [Elusimicrobiota bacterium]
MSEQPSPEPQKSKAEAAPKAASSPHGADPSRAQAYVPLPGQPKPGGRGVLVLAALIAAGALAGTALHFREPPPPPTVVVAAAEEKVLTVTDADLSLAATERVRNSAAPAPGGAPATMGTGGPAGSMGSGDASPAPPAPAAQAPAPAPASPAAAPAAENRASSPLPVAPPELISPAATAPQSALTARGQEAVRSDGYSIFSMRLIDDVAQDGDVVQISIDGVPMSFLSLTHAGATLEIPLKKGESHRITVTAVRDGTGGVTLGLQTSAGMILSRNMAVGESDSWTIDYK